MEDEMPLQIQVPGGPVVQRPTEIVAPPMQLDIAHGFTGRIVDIGETLLPPEKSAAIISLARAFESPRTATGGANPYFLSTHHFYENLMRIPGIGDNLDVCKAVDGIFFGYEIDSLVQNGSMTRERGAQLKEENASLLAGVNDWGEYVAYQDWANRVFSRYGSSFVFSGPSQALMLTIMTQTSGTVRSEIGIIGQEIMRRRISEASEREEEDEARQEAEGTGAESSRELDGFFTPHRRRK